MTNARTENDHTFASSALIKPSRIVSFAIEYPTPIGAHGDMTRIPKTCVLGFTIVVAGAAAQAACYADYKAKIDEPLRLHYGVIALSDAACGDRGRAKQEAQAKLAAAGWTLLNIVSTFGSEGLERRKADAGRYYLRF